MDSSLTDNTGDTITIRRPPRVLTDELGRTTWMGGVDPIELELEARATFNPYNSAETNHPRAFSAA